MTMYQRIKEAREKKGLSQQELAKLTGYRDRSSIAKIEAGLVDLPQSKILMFAQALGVSPADLMGLKDVRPDLLEDFRSAPDAMKAQLAKEYGITNYVTDELADARRRLGLPVLTDPDNPPLQLTPHERDVILAYRAKPNRREAVDLLLELPAEPAAQPKDA